MSFLLKNYSHVKVIYLLIRCCKARFSLWNTNNTDRNDVNKQNTHTHTHTPNTLRKITLERIGINRYVIPPFSKQASILPTPPILQEKSELASLFKNLKTQTPPFMKRSSNYDGSFTQALWVKHQNKKTCHITQVASISKKRWLYLKGCAHYIFTSLVSMSNREHLWNKE